MSAKAKQTMSYEYLVDYCKRLRREHEKAEAIFFLFLISVEEQHGPAWKEAGCATFDQFIRSNELCMVDRYRLFKAGVSKAGAEKAAAFGVPWTISVGRIREASEVQKMNERAKAFVEVNRTAPSQLAVSSWEAEARGAERSGEHTERATARASELMRLRAENAKLKTDLAAALARVAELEAKMRKK